MKSGLEFIDLLVGGYGRWITTFYGEAGTHKTTILLKAAADMSQNGKVFFIDPKHNFSIERMLQIADPNLENILLIKNFNQTHINAISSVKEIQGLIIDPLTFFWKKDMAEFVSLMAKLNTLSNQIPILCSAEVYMDIDTETLKMKAHGFIAQFSKVIILLEKRKISTGGKINIAVCKKHPSITKEGKEADFEI